MKKDIETQKNKAKSMLENTIPSDVLNFTLLPYI
jgi:hypothetical protein